MGRTPPVALTLPVRFVFSISSLRTFLEVLPNSDPKHPNVCSTLYNRKDMPATCAKHSTEIHRAFKAISEGLCSFASTISKVTSLHHPTSFFESTRCLVRVYTVLYEQSRAESFMLMLLTCTSSVSSRVNSSVADPLYGSSQNTLHIPLSGIFARVRFLKWCK